MQIIPSKFVFSPVTDNFTLAPTVTNTADKVTTLSVHGIKPCVIKNTNTVHKTSALTRFLYYTPVSVHKHHEISDKPFIHYTL